MSITAGVLSLISVSYTSASLSATAATGGVGPYTYQWYRSSVYGFVPSGVNQLSGAVSLTLTDTSVSPGTQYFYTLVATDTGAGNATAQYPQLAVFTTSTLRTGYMGALGAELSLARNAGFNFIMVTNLADLTNQMAIAAARGQRKFTVNYPVTFQPQDLRSLNTCNTARSRNYNCNCNASGGYNSSCSCGSYNPPNTIYALPVGNSLGNNGYVGNGVGQGNGTLWPAFQSGVYAALFSQDIMENEVMVLLNTCDLVTTSIDLNFTF